MENSLKNTTDSQLTDSSLGCAVGAFVCEPVDVAAVRQAIVSQGWLNGPGSIVDARDDAAGGDGARVAIEALERVSWFDPTQTGFADLKGASPSLVVKSRIRLERVVPRASESESASENAEARRA